MANKTILINRAPTLCLWAAVVAKRLGFKWDEALSLAKVLTGLNAQSKGQRLGIFSPSEKKPDEIRKAAEAKDISVSLMGRAIPCKIDGDDIRALTKGKAVSPESARKYLESKFGDDLNDVRAAMEELAKAYKPKELADKAYRLYEKFRPSIPEGTKGWGAKGELSLKQIRSLAKD